MVSVSIVLPAFNEEEGLGQVVGEIASECDSLNRAYEIVVVDDGSVDSTWDVIRDLSNGNPSIKGLRFARNFGHQLAVHAGIKATTGQSVIVMDSDGQDPPDLIPKLVELLESGHDVVNCIRKKRKESALKRFAYFAFYRFYRKLVPFEIPVDSGDFSAMNRRTADLISSVNQHTPFIRGIRSWSGGSQIDYEYERHARQTGETKYSIRKLFLLAASGITAFSKLPLRLSIIAGLTVSMASIVYAMVVVALKLLIGYPEDAGWSSLATLVAFLGGAQLTVLGIIGEYLGHVFDSVRSMPAFFERERVGFADDSSLAVVPDPPVS